MSSRNISLGVVGDPGVSGEVSHLAVWRSAAGGRCPGLGPLPGAQAAPRPAQPASRAALEAGLWHCGLACPWRPASDANELIALLQQEHSVS